MSFKDAAASLGLKEGDELLVNAQQIWSMLDEMAHSDPASYKKFIEKQKAEYDATVKANAPPLSRFTLHTSQVRDHSSRKYVPSLDTPLLMRSNAIIACSSKRTDPFA